MFFRSVLILGVVFTSALGEKSPNGDAVPVKRAPMGFQGMRGKKDLLTSAASENHDDYSKRAPMGFQLDNFIQEDYDKRARMGFQGMRGKKAISDDELYKRAPMGFQGMRGKKSMEEGMRGKKTYLSSLEYPDDYEKRAMMMGFQGMRGKKDEVDSDWDKRAPMGFQGMRGKKSLQDEIEELEKRAVMGFQGMRGKKDSSGGGGGLSSLENFLEEYEKRAPMGFHGMRGKKAAEEYDWDKRAPMGFQGMRGKKDLHILQDEDTSDTSAYGVNTDFDKRAPMGFQGMRGKKDDDRVIIPKDYIVGQQFEKRSPAFGFFGTRGKKNPRWEIRGKFVGVRGKKWLPETLHRPVDNNDHQDLNGSDELINEIERIDNKSQISPTLGNLDILQ
ncbi:tachykinins isoform X2 [Athalia rosae]|uniref:tachykinins isoform X2 n=1 Tax=Athalia rosae TaxID=37344 RepID=UPI0020334648|nr:tachykinins isoform X2 [Athalia rosae]